AGFMIGQRLQPKNDALKRSAQWWKEEVDNMRKEVNRYRSKANYYMKGAVPSELGNISEPDKLVEGILENLPANYRLMLAPFRDQIKAMAKDNPEFLQMAPALIQKILGRTEDVQQSSDTL
ncbi:MAG: hypothetical protein L0Y56_10670, partial [Nitrospira sp.]|nr:hypothetical protein [Nitrospira sp.]